MSHEESRTVEDIRMDIILAEGALVELQRELACHPDASPAVKEAARRRTKTFLPSFLADLLVDKGGLLTLYVRPLVDRETDETALSIAQSWQPPGRTTGAPFCLHFELPMKRKEFSALGFLFAKVVPLEHGFTEPARGATQEATWAAALAANNNSQCLALAGYIIAELRAGNAGMMQK